MAVVYSKRFMLGGAGNGATSPPVPAGTLWVVRDIDLFFIGSAAASYCNVTTSVGGFLFFAQGQANVGQSFAWRGRQILEAGEELVVGANASSWYWYISGYQLTLP